MAITANCRVTGNLALSSSMTGILYQIESPRSPVTTFASQSPYWM